MSTPTFWNSRACTPTSGRTTSCMAWTWRCPGRQLTMLLGRNGAEARRPHCAPSWACGNLAGHPLWRAGHHAPAHARRLPGLNIAYVPENMGIFADLTVKENMLLAARKASHAADGRSIAPAVDLQPFRRCRSSGTTRRASSAAGRSRCWPCAAPSSSRAAAHRGRSPAGPGTGHHQQHDRRLRPAQEERRDHPAGRAEHQLRQAPGRHRGGDGHGRVVHAGRMATWRTGAAAVPAGVSLRNHMTMPLARRISGAFFPWLSKQ